MPGGERSPARRAEDQASRFWGKRRARHLLTGLVVCAACGDTYTTVERDYLGCSNARGRSTCTQRRGIRRHVVETIVVDALRRDLIAADEVEAFVEGYQRVINQGRSMESAERQQVERELAALGRKLDGLYDAIAEGLRSPGLKEKLDSWEARHEALRTTVPMGLCGRQFVPPWTNGRPCHASHGEACGPRRRCQ